MRYSLKLLVVIDEYSRECLAIKVDRSFTAQDVFGILQYLFAMCGTPEYLRSDNGPEFVAQAVRRWLDQAGVATLFIATLIHRSGGNARVGKHVA